MQSNEWVTTVSSAMPAHRKLIKSIVDGFTDNDKQLDNTKAQSVKARSRFQAIAQQNTHPKTHPQWPNPPITFASNKYLNNKRNSQDLHALRGFISIMWRSEHKPNKQVSTPWHDKMPFSFPWYRRLTGLLCSLSCWRVEDKPVAAFK